MYWLLIAAVPTLILLALMSWLLVLVAEEAYLGDRAVAFLYDRAAGVYDTVKARSARHDSRRVALPLARALSGVPRPLILDVATGTGRLPLLMASQRGFAGRIIGLDLSANMLAEARRKTEGLPDAISLLREDALTLSFGDNTFDAVTCLEGLELFSRPEAALREMARVLRERVGSPVSYTSLAGDLQLAPNTVRRYIDILESLCVIFSVRPFHANVARAVLREPKIYFYDSGFVKGDDGVRLENTCAVCLQKHVHYLQDTTGDDVALHYVRTKDGREVDFALTREGKAERLIEVKLSEEDPTASLCFFAKRMPGVSALQLVHNLRREQQRDGISILLAGKWLAGLSA